MPSVIFIILAVVRLPHLLRRQRQLLALKEIPLAGHALLITRLVFGLCLFGANIAGWVLWQETDELRAEWSGWIASALEAVVGVSSGESKVATETYHSCFVSQLLLPITVILEHFRCSRPSQLPALYLLLSCFFVGSRLRTVSLVQATPVIVPLAISLATRLALFLSLQISARSSVKGGPKLPPAGTAGLISRYLVTWLVPLLWRGYRTPLAIEDLGAIEYDLYSEAAWLALSPEWSRQKQKHLQKKTGQHLLWACSRGFLGRLTAPLLPSLIYAVVSMARPLIILETITFVQNAPHETSSNGWGLVGGAFLVYAVYALSYTLAQLATQRAALALRGALMEALYRKSLVIRVEAAREMGAAKAGNLMSVDVQNVVMAIKAIHGLWTALIMTGLGLWIIYAQIGLSFVSKNSC